MHPQLAGWESFYVIVGSSAGALIGLQFVVIALLSTRSATQELGVALRAFATPTLVFFASVLVISALASVPRHTRTSLTVSLLVIGAGGAAYLVRVATHMRRLAGYVPDAGDWAWFVIVPAVSYAALGVAGASLWSAPGVALDLTGVAAMLLLLSGVHNAWDSAVWMVASRGDDNG